MTKLLFRFAILFFSLTVITACSSSSDDTPTTDPTDDTSTDTSDDSGDDDSSSTAEIFLQSMSRTNSSNTLDKTTYQFLYNSDNQLTECSVTFPSLSVNRRMFIYDGSRLTRIDVIRPGEAAVKFFEFEYNDDGSLHQFTFWYSEDNPEYYVYNYDASGRVSLVNIYVSAADLAANRPRFGKFRVYQDDALDFSEEIVESYSTITGEIQNVTARRVNAFAAQETTLNFGSALNEIPRVILLGDITRLTKDFLDFQFLPLNEDWINPETGDVQTVRSEVEPVFSSDGQLNSLQAKSYSIISDTPPTNDEIYEFTYVEQ